MRALPIIKALFYYYSFEWLYLLIYKYDTKFSSSSSFLRAAPFNYLQIWYRILSIQDMRMLSCKGQVLQISLIVYLLSSIKLLTFYLISQKACLHAFLSTNAHSRPFCDAKLLQARLSAVLLSTLYQISLFDIESLGKPNSSSMIFHKIVDYLSSTAKNLLASFCIY